MTAGSGITHSEHNVDKDLPLRFIQIWITTRQKNLKPNYGSFLGDIAARKNRWFVPFTPFGRKVRLYLFKLIMFLIS